MFLTYVVGCTEYLTSMPYIPFIHGWMSALGEGETGELGGSWEKLPSVLSYVTSGRAQRPTPWEDPTRRRDKHFTHKQTNCTGRGSSSIDGHESYHVLICTCLL